METLKWTPNPMSVTSDLKKNYITTIHYTSIQLSIDLWISFSGVLITECGLNQKTPQVRSWKNIISNHSQSVLYIPVLIGIYIYIRMNSRHLCYIKQSLLAGNQLPRFLFRNLIITLITSHPVMLICAPNIHSLPWVSDVYMIKSPHLALRTGRGATTHSCSIQTARQERNNFCGKLFAQTLARNVGLRQRLATRRCELESLVLLPNELWISNWFLSVL